MSLTQATTCLQCGSQSWDNAFVDCIRCQECVVHRYCLDVIPNTLDEFVTWYCEDCLEYITPSSEEAHGSGSMNIKETGSGPIDTKDQMFEEVPSNGVHPGLNHNHSSNSMDNEEDARLVPHGHDCGQDHVIHSSSRNGAFEEARGSGSMNIRDADSTNTEEQIFENGLSHGIPSGLNHNHNGNSMESNHESLLVTYRHDSGLDHLIHSSSGNGAFENLLTSSEYEEKPRLICNTAHNSDVSEISHLGIPTLLHQDHHRIPAQPVEDPIWRGTFVIINKRPDTYDGIVAHISNKACFRVCEEARSLKNLLYFEMHPKADVWPKSFHNTEPSDESIALYFLPADKSVEKVFDSLVEYMIGHELALKVTVENAELYLFTSIELPLAYWRFQCRYYLWGVFRRKQAALC